MFKIHILTRQGSKQYWGGDLAALYAVQKGLVEHGCKVSLISNPMNEERPDFAFMTNIFQDHSEYARWYHKEHIPYGYFSFHLNSELLIPLNGLMEMIKYIMTQKSFHGNVLTLELLKKYPEWTYLFAPDAPYALPRNFDTVDKASLIITNCPRETSWIRKDFPVSCPMKHVFWNIPSFPKGDEILKATDLKSRSYIVQIGRLSPRKNQIASILALANDPHPLVFIATKDDLINKPMHKHYLDVCFAATLKYRKAPTYFLSEQFVTRSRGPLRIINTRLTDEFIGSAYTHAKLNLHPAFIENPGFTCLESVKFGVPTVASETTSLSDYYLSSPGFEATLGGRIAYCSPQSMDSIEKAVQQQLKKPTFPPINHPIFERSPSDMGREILDILKKEVKIPLLVK